MYERQDIVFYGDPIMAVKKMAEAVIPEGQKAVVKVSVKRGTHIEITRYDTDVWSINLVIDGLIHETKHVDTVPEDLAWVNAHVIRMCAQNMD